MYNAIQVCRMFTEQLKNCYRIGTIQDATAKISVWHQEVITIEVLITQL
jgi:hypothetical protein